MGSGMLLNRLPAPKNVPAPTYDADSDPWFKTHLEVAKPVVASRFTPPPYGRRGGFMPRRPEHFGDGGAFPEIHVAQYPLDMGKETEKADSRIIPVSVDAQGKIAFDAVVKQAENARKNVFSQHSDLVPKVPTEVDTEKPSAEEAEATTERTKAALEKIIEGKLSAAQPKSVPSQSSAPSFIKYTPSQQSAAYNSGANQRVIRMVEMPKDPLEPPKFKHKRVPKASGSPPVPVMHSPPRAVTVKDQQDWKIPPCISNWKNPKGYTIPLDKRLAADGRGLQEVQINDNFAKLSEALYVSEQKAREAVEARSKIQREVMMKEKEKKENELRMLAQRARMERAGVAATTGAATGANATAVADRGGAVPFERRADDAAVSKDERVKETKEERQERLERESLRADRRRERERERRLDAKEGPAGKKSKLTRDRDSRRSNSHPGWASWNHNHNHQQQQQQQQFDGSRSYASSFDAGSTGFSIPCGSFHSGGDAHSSQIIPHCIPRFDEGVAPGLHHIPNRFEFTPETDSLSGACQGLYSGSRCSANGFAPAHDTQQVFETETQVDPTRSCSPWIERMMQADVTPTPSPINQCLSTSQGTVSCVLSRTVDLQSCHSSDRQAHSMRSAFSCEPQHESTVELSADLCTDDDDLEIRPLDVKRKKRMLSNRASAQRSRQRRQERLDQLEVMTAKLRVENSTLQKKLIAAVEVAKKFDGQNKDLLKKVDRLSKELETSGKRARKLTAAAKSNDCAASSQQTACASTCDMVGERPSVDPNVMRDDGGASTGTRSRSPSSSSPKAWPMGSYRSPPENNNNSNGGSNAGSNAGSNGRTTNQGTSSVQRKTFSACRMESKKRSHDQSESGFGAPTSPAAAAATGAGSSEALESSRPCFWHEVGHNDNPLPGLDPSLKEDGDAANCLEADRWMEFTDCFL